MEREEIRSERRGHTGMIKQTEKRKLKLSQRMAKRKGIRGRRVMKGNTKDKRDRGVGGE